MQGCLQQQSQIKILPAFNIKEEFRLPEADIDDAVRTVQGALPQLIEGNVDVITITLLEKNLKIIEDMALMKETLAHLVRNAMDTMPGCSKFLLAINQVNGKVDSLLNGDDSIIGACAFLSLAGVSTYIRNEKIKKKILEPFYTTTTDANGRCLATAYRILKQHHSRIKVKNRAGQGAEVNIYLPLNKLEIVSMMSIPTE